MAGSRSRAPRLGQRAESGAHAAERQRRTTDLIVIEPLKDARAMIDDVLNAWQEAR